MTDRQTINYLYVKNERRRQIATARRQSVVLSDAFLPLVRLRRQVVLLPRRAGHTRGVGARRRRQIMPTGGWRQRRHGELDAAAKAAATTWVA